jgi:nucleotide-binding universal stress UspA family protein
MIKTILVPTTGTGIDDVTFPAALAVARRLSAHLDFLHVRQDMTQILASMTGPGVGAFPFPTRLVTDLEQTEADREAEAKRKVEQFCGREHIAMTTASRPALQAVSAQWFNEAGNRATWIARYGQASELVVVSRSEPDGATDIDLLEAALIDCGRPIYMPGPVPRDAETVVIAWKPTREAARAVAAAAPFLVLAKRVVVLTVEEKVPENLDSAARLVATLQRHHLAVERHHVLPDGQTPVDRLLLQAAGVDAGLLVMGGYGHSRLREWVLGGFTRHVLASAPMPVLMCH